MEFGEGAGVLISFQSDPFLPFCMREGAYEMFDVHPMHKITEKRLIPVMEKSCFIVLCLLSLSDEYLTYFPIMGLSNFCRM